MAKLFFVSIGRFHRPTFTPCPLSELFRADDGHRRLQRSSLRDGLILTTVQCSGNSELQSVRPAGCSASSCPWNYVPQKKVAWIVYGNWPTSQSIAYGKFETTKVTVIIHVGIRRSAWLFRLDKIEVPPEEAVVFSDELRLATTVFQTNSGEAHGRTASNVDHGRLHRVSFASILAKILAKGVALPK